VAHATTDHNRCKWHAKAFARQRNGAVLGCKWIEQTLKGGPASPFGLRRGSFRWGGLAEP
jgi:hypothetical protein